MAHRVKKFGSPMLWEAKSLLAPCGGSQVNSYQQAKCQKDILFIYLFLRFLFIYLTDRDHK